MMDAYCGRDHLESTDALCHDFDAQLKIVPEDVGVPHRESEQLEDRDALQFHQETVGMVNDEEYKDNEKEDEEEEEDEDDFSFVLNADFDDAYPISAEDIFQNGQIRPMFSLFNRDLLLSDEESENLKDRLPTNPPVDKVFIEASTSMSVESHDVDGIASGPFCTWSKGAGASPDVCNKSNSTGFSKLWRFRDLIHRSNSDGRDAFVFLNNSATVHAKKDQQKLNEKGKGIPVKKADGTAKEMVSGINAVRKTRVKKGAKAETSSLSAYMKSRTADEDRRRSYLPYRPELVGFFTNVNGGLTRNVHPF